MPRTVEDVENYLMELGRAYELADGSKKEEGSATILLRAPNGTTIAVRVSPPIVAVNVSIGPAPTDAAHKLALYQRLLELNASDLMHVAYGLENGKIVLSTGLALDNLDKNELEATLSDIDVALARHTAELAHVARG